MMNRIMLTFLLFISLTSQIVAGCSLDQFACANGEWCIFLEWKCDGQADCNDGSDESSSTCEPTTNHTGFIDGLCYEDDASRLLEVAIESSTMTPEECKKKCLDKNMYEYAGVQFGKQCWCGNIEPPTARIRDSSECAQNCAGDESQKCGDRWRMNVYRTDCVDKGSFNTCGCTTEISYTQCAFPFIYKDMVFDGGCTTRGKDKPWCPTDVTKDHGIIKWGFCEDDCPVAKALVDGACYVSDKWHLRDMQMYIPSLTPGHCKETCASRGYLYAGIWNKVVCRCGNIQPLAKMLTGSEYCNMNTYGGPGMMRVYFAGNCDGTFSGKGRSCKAGIPCNGEENCCTPINPCDVDGGDCEKDEDCKGELKCGKNNCNKAKKGYSWDLKDDCCYNPNKITKTRPEYPCEDKVEWTRCDAGWGDCTTDGQCKKGLICGNSNCNFETPGTTEELNIFKYSVADCCRYPL